MLSIKAMGLLRRIRAEVEQGHWIKGHSTDGRGNYCLSGHVRHLMDDTDTGVEVTAELTRAVTKRHFGSIVEFNDYFKTTKQDVVEVIDETLSTGMLR